MAFLLLLVLVLSFSQKVIIMVFSTLQDNYCFVAKNREAILDKEDNFPSILNVVVMILIMITAIVIITIMLIIMMSLLGTELEWNWIFRTVVL